MNYTDTLNYLYTQLPMFQRQGAAAYKADLSNTLAICEKLNNPEKKFKSIHIAGTNGKGSTSHMLASILQEKGLKTGLYTSPHLKDFRERIRINGDMISKDFVVDFVKKNKNKFNAIKPSFFEITFGMAMQYFHHNKVDIAVVETGMGGRLDSTNVINSILSIITNIGLDHTKFLGDTLGMIAKEKAGIIKEKTPVLIGKNQAETISAFTSKAKDCNSKLFFAEEMYSIEKEYTKDSHQCFDIKIKSFNKLLDKLCIDFLGNYQKENLITVLSACEILNREGLLRIDKEDIYAGLSQATKNTGFFGRWSVLSKAPLTICDTAHNADGVKFIVEQIKKQKYSRLHIVLGFVNDKNVDEILDLFPKDAKYYFCKADIPRALDSEELMKMAERAGLNGDIYKSVENAFDNAKKNANNDDMIFIGGSTFVVAEI